MAKSRGAANIDSRSSLADIVLEHPECRPQSDVPDALLHLRRDLRGLVALELLQLAAGVGALVSIAVRAILIEGDLDVAVSIAVVVLLALSYVLLALRVRCGQGVVRRELYAMEHRHRLDEGTEELDGSSHPYRSIARRVVRNCGHCDLGTALQLSASTPELRAKEGVLPS
jgi:hypothetical protein